MLEIKSHKTKAGNGSKQNSFGASVFQPSQSKVHVNIIRKKPIDPTPSVTLTAIFSNLLKLSLCLIFTLLIGFRNFFYLLQAFLYSFFSIFFSFFFLCLTIIHRIKL